VQEKAETTERSDELQSWVTQELFSMETSRVSLGQNLEQ
jgi:hypothetical protein